MKMKWNLKILLWLTVPSIFMYFVNMMASMQYWDTNGTSSMFTKTMNHEAVCITTIIGLVTVMVIAATAMRLMYVADEIDNLEQAKKEYDIAKSEMEVVRDKYTELIISNSKSETN